MAKLAGQASSLPANTFSFRIAAFVALCLIHLSFNLACNVSFFFPVPISSESLTGSGGKGGRYCKIENFQAINVVSKSKDILAPCNNPQWNESEREPALAKRLAVKEPACNLDLLCRFFCKQLRALVAEGQVGGARYHSGLALPQLHPVAQLPHPRGPSSSSRSPLSGRASSS